MALSPIQSPGVEQQRLSTAAAHQLKVRHIQRIVTPTMAFNAAQLSSYNPRLDAGVVGGLAMAGLTPDDPVMDLVSQRAEYEQEADKKQYDHDRGVFGEWVWNPLKSVIRSGFMGLEGLMQEAESAFVRTPVGMFQGKGIGEAFSDAGRSDAYYALDSMLKGDKVHTGMGIFAQDQSQDDEYIQGQLATGRSLTDVMGSREYRQENAEYGVDVAQMGEAERSEMQITSRGGQATSVSLGRLAAISVFEPGTREFQMASGIVDAGKQILLDPADWALGGLGKAMKLRKLITPAAELADPTLLAKGMQGLKSALVPNAARKTLLARTADDWITSPEGIGFIKWVGGLNDAEGARALYEVLGKSSKAAIDPVYVRQLLETENPQNIAEMLKDGFEGGNLRNVLKQPGGAGDFIRKNLNQNKLTGTYLGRMASVTNSKVLDINDPASALAQFDLYMSNLGLTQKVKDDLLYRALFIDSENMATKYAGEMGQQDLYSQYFGLVKEATNSWIGDLGVPAGDPMHTAMNKIFESPEAFRSFWVDNMDKDVLFGGAQVKTTVDGKLVAVPSAVLMSQFLNQGIPLMDSKKIRAAMRRNWLSDAFGGADDATAAAAKLGDEVTPKTVKPLIKPSEGAKVIDEGTRESALVTARALASKMEDRWDRVEKVTTSAGDEVTVKYGISPTQAPIAVVYDDSGKIIGARISDSVGVEKAVEGRGVYREIIKGQVKHQSLKVEDFIGEGRGELAEGAAGALNKIFADIEPEDFARAPQELQQGLTDATAAMDDAAAKVQAIRDSHRASSREFAKATEMDDIKRIQGEMSEFSSKLDEANAQWKEAYDLRNEARETIRGSIPSPEVAAAGQRTAKRTGIR